MFPFWLQNDLVLQFDVEGKLKSFLRKLLVCPDYDSTWVLCNTFNPLSPNFQIQILQTGLHTFP